MKISELSEKLARSQVAHPWRYLLSTLVLTLVALVAIIGGLEFDSSYEALLPDGAPEVKNADDVRDRTGGTRQLVVAIGGKDTDARLSFGRELLERLETIDGIRCTDLELPIDFFRDRGLWLTDLDTLDRLIPALEEAVKVAKIQANPLALHLDEEDEKRELDAAWKKVDDIIGEKREDLPYDGVLASEDGKYTFLIVVPSIKFSDMAAGRRLLIEIEGEVAKLSPEKRGIEIKYAGNLKVIQEQHQVMSRDMRNASILALVFGVLIIAGFTRRLAAPFVVGASLVSGVAWTFAMAWVYVGHVNIITGFLGAVLIGLGIDFGIHLFVRYKQEFIHPGATSEQAIVDMVKGTISPAVTSALTTAGVFFSFTIADFRGFSEFGLIAGTGVMFTLFSSFLIVPPLLALVYRGRKTPEAADANDQRPGALAARIPVPLALTVAVVMLGAAVLGAIGAKDIPFRNNFKTLRGKSEATEFIEYVDKNLGAGFNPAVFLARNVQDAEEIRLRLLERKDKAAAGDATSRIGNVLSVTDLLPRDVAEHQPRIKKLYDILWDPKLDRAAAKEGHRADKLTEARRMVETVPWNPEDIPDQFRRRFTTLDGKELLVYVWPTSPNNADYQAAAWEDELKEVSRGLEKDGISHEMADETLIIARIYRLISKDGPPLLIVAAAVVFLFLLLDFRSPKKALIVAFPLSVGMLAFMGAMRVWGMELNMFNLVVVPSVIGIGIDNSVHIYHRYLSEGRGSIVFVLRNTGVAALLASLTTAVGFGASMISHNVGLQTLGSTAVVGISATFLAAAVFFPSAITLAERLSKKRPG